MSKQLVLVATGSIERQILTLRGQRVILGPHLAALYGVETRALNQSVKRNVERFPPDFAFQLTPDEAAWLVSQSVIPHKKFFGGALPYAFTEQGIAMLSSVLRSERAIQVNVAIMRTFVHLRNLLAADNALSKKLDKLERKYKSHDKQILGLVEDQQAPDFRPGRRNRAPTSTRQIATALKPWLNSTNRH